MISPFEEGLTNIIRQDKEITGVEIGKELLFYFAFSFLLSVLVDDMIIYICAFKKLNKRHKYQ